MTCSTAPTGRQSVPKTVLESVAGCPKYCPDCGLQGLCINSRREQGAVMRRYRCHGCVRRWTTLEVLVEENGKGQRGHVKRYLRRRFNAEVGQRLAIEGLRKDLDAALATFSQRCAS